MHSHLLPATIAILYYLIEKDEDVSPNTINRDVFYGIADEYALDNTLLIMLDEHFLLSVSDDQYKISDEGRAFLEKQERPAEYDNFNGFTVGRILEVLSHSEYPLGPDTINERAFHAKADVSVVISILNKLVERGSLERQPNYCFNIKE